uniref:Protein kinase domain-containing protein n=1 Tax=Macrostomum lignano TaxID=282301 RepID=A0A1I8F6A2_9PLAT
MDCQVSLTEKFQTVLTLSSWELAMGTGRRDGNWGSACDKRRTPRERAETRARPPSLCASTTLLKPLRLGKKQQQRMRSLSDVASARSDNAEHWSFCIYKATAAAQSRSFKPKQQQQRRAHSSAPTRVEAVSFAEKYRPKKMHKTRCCQGRGLLGNSTPVDSGNDWVGLRDWETQQTALARVAMETAVNSSAALIKAAVGIATGKRKLPLRRSAGAAFLRTPGRQQRKSVRFADSALVSSAAGVRAPACGLRLLPMLADGDDEADGDVEHQHRNRLAAPDAAPTAGSEHPDAHEQRPARLAILLASGAAFLTVGQAGRRVRRVRVQVSRSSPCGWCTITSGTGLRGLRQQQQPAALPLRQLRISSEASDCGYRRGSWRTPLWPGLPAPSCFLACHPRPATQRAVAEPFASSIRVLHQREPAAAVRDKHSARPLMAMMASSTQPAQQQQSVRRKTLLKAVLPPARNAASSEHIPSAVLCQAQAAAMKSFTLQYGCDLLQETRRRLLKRLQLEETGAGSQAMAALQTVESRMASRRSTRSAPVSDSSDSDNNESADAEQPAASRPVLIGVGPYNKLLTLPAHLAPDIAKVRQLRVLGAGAGPWQPSLPLKAVRPKQLRLATGCQQLTDVFDELHSALDSWQGTADGSHRQRVPRISTRLGSRRRRRRLTKLKPAVRMSPKAPPPPPRGRCRRQRLAEEPPVRGLPGGLRGRASLAGRLLQHRRVRALPDRQQADERRRDAASRQMLFVSFERATSALDYMAAVSLDGPPAAAAATPAAALTFGWASPACTATTVGQLLLYICLTPERRLAARCSRNHSASLGLDFAASCCRRRCRRCGCVKTQPTFDSPGPAGTPRQTVCELLPAADCAGCVGRRTWRLHAKLSLRPRQQHLPTAASPSPTPSASGSCRPPRPDDTEPAAAAAAQFCLLACDWAA